MNGQIYLWEITRYLAWFTSQVRIENNSGNFDINKYAEGFLIPILNPIFKKEFERLEFIKQNYPAIDLGSKDKEISFQVTSEKGYDKIKNTLTKYIENKLYNVYANIYHFIINEDYQTSKSNDDIALHINRELKKIGLSPIPKIKFTKEEQLWNISVLRKQIEKECNIDQLKEIRDYLEKEYGKVTSLPTFDDILVPFEIAFKAQLDLSNKNLSYQFHTPFFGREKDIERLESFINGTDNSVFAIIADGGYGKTRLAIELFRKITKESDIYEAYVLNEVTFQCIDFAEQLKTTKQIVILFDDAHNKPEILNDLISVTNRLDNVKLILTVRKAVYSDTIKSISTHNRDIETLELKRLSYLETQELFKSQLPGLKDIEIKKLAEESKGVPVVVLGLCQISLEGKYKSELSEDDNFLHFVRELKDQVIVDISNIYFIPKEKINKTIQLLSFFSPIKNTKEEISVLANLNGFEVEETNLILDYLQEYDFIYKHNEISIKPDPYSDTILLDSAKRIKYLLQQDIKLFIDRLIRNLVEVEQSQRLDFSLDNLLFDFVSSFKNKGTKTSEEMKVLNSNLDTLKSFTYKKPQICFLAIKNLINSQLENNEFWEKEDEFVLYSKSFKEIHENIQIVLSIAALNTHSISELESIYDLVKAYDSKLIESNVFHKVFGYRIYDFYEYGYRPVKPCERQLFLVNKLESILQHSKIDQKLFYHLFNCCKILLSLEFENESYYDKYTHSYTYGRAHVIFNDTTKFIRENALKILFKIYEINRSSKESEEYLKEIIKILFFMGKQRKDEYQFNQEREVELVIDFIMRILKDSPNLFEKSTIIRQIKLFEKREIKEGYVKKSQEILDLAESSKTPKERLELLFLDEYFSLKDRIEVIIKDLLTEYKDCEQFYYDIVEVKIELVNADYTNFHEIISQLAIHYPDHAKNLLDFVIKKYPKQVCDFNILIRANYKDQHYFYKTIDKIWNINLDCAKASVLWSLTYGRNQEIGLYKESDLDFVEFVVDTKIERALWSISFTLHKYILINPDRTINLISKIIKDTKNRREIEHLIHAIFDNKEILEKYPERIRDFIFKHTFNVPLDSYYFESALAFLDNKFGFDTLFQYLIEKINFLEEQGDYFSLTLHQHYNNPTKDTIKVDLDFLIVIEWYADLSEKSDFLQKKLVEYLRPIEIKSVEFANGFKTLVNRKNKDINWKIDLCNALDVYENKSEFLFSLLIEVASELCDQNDLSRDDLIKILGTNFIHNLGFKSGIPGQPFPQDLAKRDFISKLLVKYPMHQKVKEILEGSLENIKKDIDRDLINDIEEKW